MAIGAVARGDLVVVHSVKYGIRGLYVVDAVNGNAVTVAAADNMALQSGGSKTSNMFTVDKTTEIFAVHTAASTAN